MFCKPTVNALPATVVTLDGNPATIVTHCSKPYTDAFGTRATNLVFAEDNHAYFTDENDSAFHEPRTVTTRVTFYGRKYVY